MASLGEAEAAAMQERLEVEELRREAEAAATQERLEVEELCREAEAGATHKHLEVEELQAQMQDRTRHEEDARLALSGELNEVDALHNELRAARITSSAS